MQGRSFPGRGAAAFSRRRAPLACPYFSTFLWLHLSLPATCVEGAYAYWAHRSIHSTGKIVNDLLCSCAFYADPLLLIAESMQVADLPRGGLTSALYPLCRAYRH